MNKQLRSLSLALAIGLSSLSALAENDKIIQPNELPATAQSFIKQHFAGQKVSLVKLDKELFDRNYEVIFADGSKVEFNKKGEWKDIDCQHTSFPLSAVPKAILTHVHQHFSGQKILQIEKTERGRIAVELSSGVELLFDSKYRFVGLDD